MGRRLGQHFLFDPAILDRIVDALEPAPEDTVLEIGAGLGTLTRRLAARAARVIAIEKDRKLAGKLREMGDLSPGTVSVVEADALDLDWPELVAAPDAGGRSPGGYRVTGNIPYAITSPLIAKALSAPLPRMVVFLVQREVAGRLAAAAGTSAYGALSVGVQVVADAEQLFTVRAGAFKPPPKVDSAVVRLTPLAAPLVAPHEHAEFRRFVTALFSRRRKQLGGAIRGVTGRTRPDVEARLEGLGIGPTVRCETLPPAEFVALYGAFARS